MKVKTTLGFEVEVDEREAEDLARQGLLVEEKPVQEKPVAKKDGN